jgi:hypothetical protein
MALISQAVNLSTRTWYPLCGVVSGQHSERITASHNAIRLTDSRSLADHTQARLWTFSPSHGVFVHKPQVGKRRRGDPVPGEMLRADQTPRTARARTCLVLRLGTVNLRR